MSRLPYVFFSFLFILMPGTTKDLGLMSLLDHEGTSSRGGLSDQEPSALPHPYPVPHPYSSVWSNGGGGRGGGRSHQSDGSGSSGSNCSEEQKEGEGEGGQSGMTKEEVSSPPVESPGDVDAHQSPPPNTDSTPSQGPVRELSSVPPEVSASRQSFRLAMGNPSEFFVDVM